MANQLEQAQARFERLKTNLDKFLTKNKALLDKYAKYNINVTETRWGSPREIIKMYNLPEGTNHEEIWKLMDALDMQERKQTELEEARKRLTMLKDKAAVKQSDAAAIDAEVAILEPMLEEFKKAYRTRRLEMAITAHRVMWTENKPKWEKALAEAEKEREVMQEDYAIYTTRAKEYNDLYKKITELKRKLSAEELRYPELSDYLEVVEEHIEKCWTNSVRILASKTLVHGGISGYKVQHLSFNEARIEALFSCEGKKSLYARLIWAAEYSCLVSPHERYIVTER